MMTRMESIRTSASRSSGGSFGSENRRKVNQMVTRSRTASRSGMLIGRAVSVGRDCGRDAVVMFAAERDVA